MSVTITELVVGGRVHVRGAEWRDAIDGVIVKFVSSRDLPYAQVRDVRNHAIYLARLEDCEIPQPPGSRKRRSRGASETTSGDVQDASETPPGDKETGTRGKTRPGTRKRAESVEGRVPRPYRDAFPDEASFKAACRAYRAWLADRKIAA